MEHIKILDGLLKYLIETEYTEFGRIRNDVNDKSDFLKDIDNSTLHSALLKLVKDGYVNQTSKHSTDQLFNTPRTDHYFKISFEGLVFIDCGGYENQIRKNQTLENLKNEMTERQNALESKQVRFQGQIAFLTWVIALGTLISGVYYFLEILKVSELCVCG